MTDHSEIDHVSGTSTTGHQWDGIKELNTPLPRWWLITFYLTIVWAIGYWIVYPAWPLLWSHTTGIWNYSTRAEVATELANLEKIRGDKMVALGNASLEEIEKNPALLALARARGKTVFGDNCAPCHGSGGAGAKGYPNLNDDEWIWGGGLDQIMHTIQFGARSGHAKAHESAMLASARTASSRRMKSSPSPTTCGGFRACRRRPATTRRPGRSCLPTIAPLATATTARGTRNSARPT
jgi:cytochrome c oxidase cbb3-type subunit 3